MGDDPMALLGLEGALKHYYYLLLTACSGNTLMGVHGWWPWFRYFGWGYGWG
jgi:hypothetical protein